MARLTTKANNTNYNNGNSELVTSPQTKQSHYYYNHQDLINQKRRLKYSNNKLQTNNNFDTQGKTKQTNKPNDVQISNFNSISSLSNKATKDNLEPIYSYNDLINYGFRDVGSPECKSASYAGTMSSYHGKAKTRKEPRLADFIIYCP